MELAVGYNFWKLWCCLRKPSRHAPGAATLNANHRTMVPATTAKNTSMRVFIEDGIIITASLASGDSV